jgi:4-hydroxy-tetrahydrodipicolinate synthase
LAGTNSLRPDETIVLSRRARELGYQGLLLAAPPYSLPSNRDLAIHFRRIAAEVGLPIMLYNFPARTGVDMTPDFLDLAVEIPEIVAIKESSGSITRLHELTRRYGGRLDPVCGADDQVLEYFLWGARSFVAGASNFLPDLHVALFDACVVQQDFVRGRQLMDQLMPMFELLEGGGRYIQYTKLGVCLAGFEVGTVRPPLGPLTDVERTQFRTIYESLRVGRGSGARSA